MRDLPQGKGLYIWMIKQMPDEWAEKFVGMGIEWIAVKVADGVNSFNLRPKSGGGWVDDILGPFILEAREAGIRVLGWQYVYGYNPMSEADKAAQRINKFDLDGFLIDAERQYIGKPTQASQYSKSLRSLVPDVPIGLSTYRFPSLFPAFPFKQFLEYCDFNAPQVYWNAGKSRQELEASYDQYLKIKRLPFIPAGSSYYGEGFPKPTPAETTEFLTTAQELDCPAAFFWSADALWHRLKSLPEIRLAISKYEWGDDGGLPIPPVEPPITHPNVMTLNKLEVQYENTVYETNNAIWLHKKE